MVFSNEVRGHSLNDYISCLTLTEQLYLTIPSYPMQWRRNHPNILQRGLSWINNKYTHSIVRKKLLNILLSIFLLFNFLNLPPESVEMLFPDFIFQTFPNPLQNQPRISALLSLNIFLRHCTPSFFLYNYCVILLFFLDWEIFANLRNAVIRFLHCCPANA
jgi:hypothetical protein